MNDVHDSYLETQVRTATPQKLRLMLIEGAIRFLQRGEQSFRQDDVSSFVDDIIRAREIATELFASIRPDGDFEFVRVTRAVHGYLLHELAECQRLRDVARIPGLLAVLAAERETWRQVCDQETEPLMGMLPHALSGVLPGVGSSLSLEA